MAIDIETLNRYAADGLCHNANTGTYGHECGRLATWIATKANGFRSGFCDRCKVEGDERHGFDGWGRLAQMQPGAHEKSEWSRFAQAAYRDGHNGVGHRFSAAASLPHAGTINIHRFDALQRQYRAWLNHNEYPAF